MLAMRSGDVFPDNDGYANNWPERMYVFHLSRHGLFCDTLAMNAPSCLIGWIGFPSAAYRKSCQVMYCSYLPVRGKCPEWNSGLYAVILFNIYICYTLLRFMR